MHLSDTRTEEATLVAPCPRPTHDDVAGQMHIQPRPCLRCISCAISKTPSCQPMGGLHGRAAAAPPWPVAKALPAPWPPHASPCPFSSKRWRGKQQAQEACKRVGTNSTPIIIRSLCPSPRRISELTPSLFSSQAKVTLYSDECLEPRHVRRGHAIVSAPPTDPAMHTSGSLLADFSAESADTLDASAAAKLGQLAVAEADSPGRAAAAVTPQKAAVPEGEDGNGTDQDRGEREGYGNS